MTGGTIDTTHHHIGRPQEEDLMSRAEAIARSAADDAAAERHVTVSVRGRVAVVALSGDIDVDVATWLAPTLSGVAQRHPAVILDLGHARLLDATAFASVTRAVDHRPGSFRCCIVAGRGADRQAIERRGAAGGLAIFGSVGDALQAQAFAEEGYGHGWTPVTDHGPVATRARARESTGARSPATARR